MGGTFEKLENVRAMKNEDFIDIQRKMVAEEEREKMKNTTLKEIQQQQRVLSEIVELESEIDRCEPERIKLVQKLEEQVKKLTSDVPEAGFTVEDNLDSFSATYSKLLCDLQLKRNHLQR